MEVLKAFAPFQYDCYSLGLQGAQVYSDRFSWQVEQFTPDIYYEGGPIMDQVRTVSQIIELPKSTEEALTDKHYYVMGRGAGVVFNILGTDNYDY